MLEAWKTFHRRRLGFAATYTQPIFTGWLEESMEVDDYPMPLGDVPDFIEARAAYSRAKWLGPGRGLVDIVKERQGASMGVAGGFSSLEDECAETGGTDWREVAQRRAVEEAYYRDLGLRPPATLVGDSVKEASAIPEEV